MRIGPLTLFITLLNLCFSSHSHSFELDRWFAATKSKIERDPVSALRLIQETESKYPNSRIPVQIIAAKIYVSIYLENIKTLHAALSTNTDLNPAPVYLSYIHWGQSYKSWRENDYDSSINWSDQQIQIVSSLNDPNLLAQAFFWRMYPLYGLERTLEIGEIANKLHGLIDTGKLTTIGELEASLGIQFFYRVYHQDDAYIAASDNIINLQEQIGNKQQLAGSYYALGMAFERKGLNENAYMAYQKSVDFATEANHVLGILSSHSNLAELYGKMGDYQKAYNVSKTLPDQLAEHGQITNATHAKIETAYYAAKIGNTKASQFWLNNISKNELENYIKRHKTIYGRINEIRSYITEDKGDLVNTVDYLRKSLEIYKNRFVDVKNKLNTFNQLEASKNLQNSKIDLLKKEIEVLKLESSEQDKVTYTLLFFLLVSLSTIAYRKVVKGNQLISNPLQYDYQVEFPNQQIMDFLLTKEMERYKRFQDPYIYCLVNLGEDKIETFHTTTHLLKNQLRSMDTVAQISSSILAVLLPNTDIHQGKELVKKISKNLKSQLPDCQLGYTIPLIGDNRIENIKFRAEHALIVCQKRDSKIELRAA